MAERGVDDDLVVVLILGFPEVTQHHLRSRFLAQVCCPPDMGGCVCVGVHVCMCACMYAALLSLSLTNTHTHIRPGEGISENLSLCLPTFSHF
jgi:hypothetical protein